MKLMLEILTSAEAREATQDAGVPISSEQRRQQHAQVLKALRDRLREDDGGAEN
jgi:hypothetical protein